jgi:hypothetical protein
LIRTQAEPVRHRHDRSGRLREAARVRASLRDPHLLRAQFVENGPGDARLRLERLDAPTLAEVLEVERLDQRAAVTMVAGVARAVALLEANGLVARDLVPERVLLDDVRGAVLAEAGIPPELVPLRRPEPDPRAPYRAPEERLHGELGPRASVYSLGALMIAALSGREPPERIPQPSEPRRRDLPQTLGSVIARAMADDPERRYASTIDMARAAVQAVRAGERLDAAGATSPTRAKLHVIRRASLTQLAQAPRLVLREAAAAGDVTERAAEDAAKRAEEEAAKRARRAARAREAAAKKAAAHAEQERRARHRAEQRAAKAAERSAERERSAQAAAEAEAAERVVAEKDAAERAAAGAKAAAEREAAAEPDAARRRASVAPAVVRRRRAGVAAAAAGLIGVAAGAAALAPGESTSSAHGVLRISDAELSLRLPPSWERAHPSTAPYGGLSNVLGARSTAPGRVVLMAGTIAEPSDTTAALRRLAPHGARPAATDVGRFETMRYAGLRPRPGVAANAYMLNTTGASLLIVCEAPPASRTRLDACAKVAATLRLQEDEPLSLAAARARRPAVEQALNELAEARLADRRRIAQATIAEQQAAAATDLQFLYYDASQRIETIGLPGADAARLLRDLRAAGDSYGALATAIRDVDQVAYDAARADVIAAETAVWDALPGTPDAL